ncbi:MAG: hypothetical protein AAFU79_31125, partial [Myxococcota bacterium]
PPVTTPPGTNLDNPATFAVGEIVGGRIDPDSTSNFRHYWDIELEPGLYHLLLEESTPDGRRTNVGLQVAQLDDTGVEQQRLLRGNEIDHRNREHTLVDIQAATTLRLEVSTVFGMEDYRLAVFENAAPVPSPFFEDCPIFMPIGFGTPVNLTLGDKAAEDDDEAWLTFAAPAGDYRFTVDAEQSSGVSTNLQYELGVMDRFGQEDRYVRVVRANEIDVIDRQVGSLNTGEAASYWVRIENSHDALNLTVTLEQD